MCGSITYPLLQSSVLTQRISPANTLQTYSHQIHCLYKKLQHQTQHALQEVQLPFETIGSSTIQVCKKQIHNIMPWQQLTMQAIKARVMFLHTSIDMHTYDTLSCSVSENKFLKTKQKQCVSLIPISYIIFFPTQLLPASACHQACVPGVCTVVDCFPVIVLSIWCAIWCAIRSREAIVKASTEGTHPFKQT